MRPFNLNASTSFLLNCCPAFQATRKLTGLAILDVRATFLKAPKRLPVTLHAS